MALHTPRERASFHPPHTLTLSAAESPLCSKHPLSRVLHPPATLRNRFLLLLSSLQIRPASGELVRALSCAGAPRGLQPCRARKESPQSGMSSWLLANWISGQFLLSLALSHLPAFAHAVLHLSGQSSGHLLPLPSLRIPRDYHWCLCIFSTFYLHLFIILITSSLVFWFFLYLIFPILKALREWGPYPSHIDFLQSTPAST